MHKLEIPASEWFNDSTNEFVQVKKQTLQLEHSLLSIRKWESKWHKPFLGKDPRTYEESIDYIRCMTVLPKDVDPMVYSCITPFMLEGVKAYIDDPMTATWFNDKNAKKSSRKIITAEVIYSWMVTNGIPFECEKWHLNQLLTLIHVCNSENAPKKKMSKRDIYSQNHMLNEARKKSLNTKG